jgi:predicted solute-binding protein
LRELSDVNLENIDGIISRESEFPPEFCRHYYRDHLRFSFGDEEKRGLRAFAELCRKHELLPKRDLVLDLV